MTTSLATRLQPTIWQNVTPDAQVNDIICKPFCPIARVIDKEVLANGRTCLIVCFPNCDQHVEEWVLPAVKAVVPTADVIPVRDTIAEATAVVGNSDYYADGIRRDSAIRKLRAEEKRAICAM